MHSGETNWLLPVVGEVHEFRLIMSELHFIVGCSIVCSPSETTVMFFVQVFEDVASKISSA